MAFLDHVRRCNRHDLSRYRPVVMRTGREHADVRVGWIREDRLLPLSDCAVAAGVTERIEVSAGGVRLLPSDEASRSAVLAALVGELAGRGLLRVTGELYGVRRRVGTERYARLDRGAVPFFGVAATGVHVNGFVMAADGSCRMWIAHRARGKATFPGMLDNLVAGGQPEGLSLDDNVVKECAEEAGIPVGLASRARPVGAVSYVFENDSGLKPDTMFCYDLEVPADFHPRPVDGEVERFELLPLAEVAELVRDTERFKFNCNLVILDFLVRHGWFRPEDPDYLPLVAGLHRALPDLEGVP